MNNKPSNFVAKYKEASGGYGSGLVPLLEHGDQLVIESDVVAKYVATNIRKIQNNEDGKGKEEGGEGGGEKDFLYPQEEDIEACDIIDQFLSQWYPVTDRYYDVLCAGDLQQTKECQQDFIGALCTLENILKDEKNNRSNSIHKNEDYDDNNGHFLLGKHFSLAECISAPWVQRFYVTLPYFRNLDFNNEIQDMHHLSKWMKAVCDRPSVIASKCPEEEMIAAAKKYYVSYITPGANGIL